MKRLLDRVIFWRVLIGSCGSGVFDFPRRLLGPPSSQSFSIVRLWSPTPAASCLWSPRPEPPCPELEPGSRPISDGSLSHSTTCHKLTSCHTRAQSADLAPACPVQPWAFFCFALRRLLTWLPVSLTEGQGHTPSLSPPPQHFTPISPSFLSFKADSSRLSWMPLPSAAGSISGPLMGPVRLALTLTPHTRVLREWGHEATVHGNVTFR